MSGDIDAAVERMLEALSLTSFFFTCGKCQKDWQTSITSGERRLIECPHCGNVSLQQIRGA